MIDYKMVCVGCRGQTLTYNLETAQSCGVKRDNGDYVTYCPECRRDVMGELFGYEERQRARRKAAKGKGNGKASVK